MPEWFAVVFLAVWFALSLICFIYAWVKLKPEYADKIEDWDKGYLKLMLFQLVISLVISGLALGTFIIL